MLGRQSGELSSCALSRLKSKGRNGGIGGCERLCLKWGKGSLKIKLSTGQLPKTLPAWKQFGRVDIRCDSLFEEDNLSVVVVIFFSCCLPLFLSFSPSQLLFMFSNWGERGVSLAPTNSYAIDAVAQQCKSPPPLKKGLSFNSSLLRLLLTIHALALPSKYCQGERWHCQCDW